MVQTGVCEWCGVELPPKGSRGPARRYCSGRCREAAHRDRTMVKKLQPFEGYKSKIPTPPLPSMNQRRSDVFAKLAALVEGEAPAPVEARLARAIWECRLAADVFASASDKLPPALRWRAEQTATTLTKLLDDMWQGVADGSPTRSE